MIDESVEVVEHDPRWQSWYALDAHELREELGERIHDLQHFGSTSVPGLPAKPIIDILVAPVSWPLAADDLASFEKLGFESLGEAGVPERIYLRRRAEHATNLAVVQESGPLWHDNILLRDYLLSHPDHARAYGDLKRAVWNQGARTLLDYSRAKHDFVDDLLARARLWRSSEPASRVSLP
ncbi:MAG: GrpB family protein [Polyangiaceae bacterium]